MLFAHTDKKAPGRTHNDAQKRKRAYTHIDVHSGRDKHAEILPPKHFSARAASSMRQN